MEVPSVQGKRSAAEAPLLSSGITIKVTDVKLCKEPLSTQNAQKCLATLLKVPPSSFESMSHNNGKDLFHPTRLNPFVATVHASFDEHYPLELSPDSFWTNIAQGFANHINKNPEKYRSLFVSHQGQEIIRILRDEFTKGNPNNDWEGTFHEFSDCIKAKIGEQLHSMVVSNFSTTTIIEKTVSEIVLMDTVKNYFDFRVCTRCGIPSIFLTGTVDDWKSIRERIKQFSAFDLDWWVKELSPILEKIVDTVQGKVDTDFWQSFYKFRNGSGGPHVSGWINVLFPYIQTNNILEQNKFVSSWNAHSRGPQPTDFPIGLSMVPFIWEYLGTTIPMEFVGGFIGVSQDSSLMVKPALGWAVLPRSEEEGGNK